jgi:MerR family transcriptional regulator, light-induced transcriptional regulator
MVVATPAGQLHDLGASIVAAVVTNLGWRVTNLGASLPAPEIAGSAIQTRARAVALSIVYPDDDPGLPGELARLRAYLPPEVAIVAGGRGVDAYRDSLEKIGALVPSGLLELCSLLDGLPRAQRPRGSTLRPA